MRQKQTPRRLSNQEKRNKAEWSSRMVLRLTMASFTRSADSTMIASDASVVKHIPITRKQAEKITKHKSVSCFHQAQASAKPKQRHITLCQCQTQTHRSKLKVSPNLPALAWAVSQHTDTSKNTGAILKRLSCTIQLGWGWGWGGALFNHDKLLE